MLVNEYKAASASEAYTTEPEMGGSISNVVENVFLGSRVHRNPDYSRGLICGLRSPISSRLV